MEYILKIHSNVPCPDASDTGMSLYRASLQLEFLWQKCFELGDFEFFVVSKCLFVTANLCKQHVFISGLFLYPFMCNACQVNFFKLRYDTW